MTQKVDTLFTNAFILTMDESMTQYSPGAVAVKGDSILAVGPEQDILRDFSAQEIFNCGGKILMPGLINAHYHSHDTLCRGMFEELPLEFWLLYTLPMGANRSKEEFMWELYTQKQIKPWSHYMPIHLTAAYRKRGHSEGECPVAEVLFQKYVSLPVHPRLTQGALDYLVGSVRELATTRSAEALQAS
jgi:hypothetical protein